jgi:hypothetical protein
MRNRKEILKEISSTNSGLESIKSTGGKPQDVEFLTGWMQALAWVLTTTDEEAST